MFYAVLDGQLYVLALMESKSMRNASDIGRSSSAYAGQMGWDFERLREVPIRIDNVWYEPDNVRVSKRWTEFVGIIPPEAKFSQRARDELSNAFDHVQIVTGPVRDSILRRLAESIRSVYFEQMPLFNRDDWE